MPNSARVLTRLAAIVVVGGLAANVHGSQRVTKDIDIAYLSESHNVLKLCAVLNRYETFHRSDGHVIKLHMDQGEGQHWNTAPGNLYNKPMNQIEQQLRRYKEKVQHHKGDVPQGGTAET